MSITPSLRQPLPRSSQPIAQWLSPVLAQVFSQRCACCRESGPAICRSCRFALASARPVDAGNGVAAAMPFDGAGRSAILSMKYGNRRPIAAHLARLMVRRLRLTEPGERFDAVTWAPTSRARLRERGFDQAELLAREVARLLGVPCRRLLHRTHGAPQTGRARAERVGAEGPAFQARAARSGLRVLVVDDVITTGSTLAAAGRALAAVGVDHVRLVAAAATPRPASVVHISAATGRSATARAAAVAGAPMRGQLSRLPAGAPVGSIPA